MFLKGGVLNDSCLKKFPHPASADLVVLCFKLFEDLSREILQLQSTQGLLAHLKISEPKS